MVDSIGAMSNKIAVPRPQFTTVTVGDILTLFGLVS